jgi:hypothetical protein|tara:strand:- start:26 stop:253 length:228 start_codon:yes stop_codon:yes gene_type:complete
MTPQKEEEVLIHGIMEDYGKVVVATPKAYLIKMGINNEAFWIPASICDFQVSEKGYEATAPEWFLDKVETIELKS